jgi:hypothetical protein
MARRLFIFSLLLLTACSPLLQSTATEDVLSSQETGTANENTPTVEVISPTSPSSPATRRVEDPHEYQIPDRIPYDAILPIYEPEFAPSSESPLEEEELVMGVALNGEAKAYPVTVLRIREMVNDELGGLPILVTW